MAVTDTPAIIGGAGFTCARIAPVNYAPVDGDYAFVVGSDVVGRYDTVAIGDIAGVEQDVDVTSITLLTFAVKFRQTVGVRGAHVRGLGATYPTGFAGGETLQVDVDGGGTDTITFVSTDQSIDEVIDRINAGLSAGAALEDNAQLRINSPTVGASSSVEIVGGTALTALGLTTGTENGETINFKLTFYVGATPLLDIQPDPNETEEWIARTVNLKSYSGTQTLKLVVEAVS